MGIEIVDLVKLAHDGKKRKVVFNTPKFHAWVHVYSKPGDKDDMHCHNADQTFYMIEGECTMHFPDREKAVMGPGMTALIQGGSFYQLENTGHGTNGVDGQPIRTLRGNQAHQLRTAAGH